MPPGSRAVALDALKQSLIKRFGASASDIVEQHVHGLSKQAKLTGADIDGVERSILAVVKQRRWGGMSRSQSAAGPLSSMGQQQKGIDREMLRSASGHISPVSVAASNNSKRAPSVRPDSCASSRHDPPPRYPVPKKPLSKPHDHWDLILRYDRAKYEEEELTRMRGRRGGQAEYRMELDKQMDEIRERREEGIREKEQEREIMLMEESRRKADDEAHAKNLEAKRIKLSAFMTEMLGGKERREARAKARDRRDRDELYNRLAAEDEIDRIQKAQAKERQQRRATETRELLKEVTQRKAEQKANDAKRDKDMVKRYIADLDEKEAAKKAAMEARLERMMSICNRHSLLAKEDPRIQIAEDRAQMVKALAEADAVAAEMSRLEKEKRAKQIAETRKALAVQVTEKADRILREKDENDQQAAIWEKQAAEFAASEQAKVDKIRQKRDQLDKELIKQMKVEMGTHIEHRVDPAKVASEIALNRPIYEQMARDGFCTSEAQNVLSEAQGKKTGFFPSVPAYEGELHELELPAVD
eukprot:gnl/MRDRNA2_/MRDRNA2_88092_c0_seq1.p1 gnl/MRDRNA2_/MRDRNA2_88092_c0~~gnl/MRDRNA2_/MRDRNA2_88092_c0_seq1.p1  ORF type:complete len:530 (-),score=143.90 gnl/MRDRNA2_/MRDRNA2_88092_c0_seq1:295-1884(-)